MKQSFDTLITEAIDHTHHGWDFSYIADRRHSENPPWAYGDTILTKLDGVQAMADIDTGGGEFLLSLHDRAINWPLNVTATEGYAPNVSLARDALSPIGVEVIDADAGKPLPFENGEFDLIINRHGAFIPSELWRILKPGGKFITQQVGSEMNIGMNELLGAPLPDYRDWFLERATSQLTEAGFTILDQKENRGRCTFDDVGALVWYLHAIPWQVPDFSVERYEAQLRKVHNEIGRSGPVEVMNHFFYIEAQKS